ncbi:hypothetical protein MNBD_GAMMA15-2040, partial [hydrothermal vent metagenome]
FHPFQRLVDTGEIEPELATLQSLCLGRPYTVLPSIEYARLVAEDSGTGWVEVSVPGETEQVQVIDLTELFPVQFGALLVGFELEPEVLWSKFGCYDHFKVRYLLSCLALPGWDVESVRRARAKNHQLYLDCFEKEDAKIKPEADWIDGFEFACEGADYLARRLSEFGVRTRREEEFLVLPCHQELTAQDIEYVYAIYRGYLNLCSEWKSTGIRGSIKLTGS